MMRALPALLLVWVVGSPLASALDVLPSESRLGGTHALLVVRSASGGVTVRAEPPILAGAEGADELAATPRTLAARGPWRGLDGVVLIELRRADASVPVEIVVEDAGAGPGAGNGAGTGADPGPAPATGAWIEWPGASVAVSGAERAVPSGLLPIAGALVGAWFMRRSAARRACATR